MSEYGAKRNVEGASAMMGSATRRSGTVRRTVCFLIFVFASVGGAETLAASAGRLPGVVYLSPLPGSNYLTPQTTIIIRASGTFDPASLESGSIISVSGSVSGTHHCSSVLVQHDSTLLVIPETPFSHGETVDVSTSGALRIAGGSAFPHLDFIFHIGAGPLATKQSGAWREFGPPDLPASRGPESRGAQQPAKTSTDTLPTDFPIPTIIQQHEPLSEKIFLGTFKTGRTGSHREFITLVPSDEQYLMILGTTGAPQYWKRMPSENMGFTLQANGLLTYYDLSAGRYFEMDSSYKVVNDYECGNGYQTDIHELRVLSNGHALLLGYDPEVVDMSKIAAGGDSTATVWGMVIQELDAGKHVIFQWRSFDHFLITDATHEDLTASSIDYVHPNALELDGDGNILLSSRHLDEITKINRTTGDIIWRWGGKHNQFQFINDTLGFSHQHSIRRTSAGTYILFDNGNYRPVEFSRGVEYSLDEEKKTATQIWQYRHSPDIFATAMGSIERLPDGGTILGWGTASLAFTELRADGTVALEAQLPDSIVSYRALAFNWPSASSATAVKKKLPGPGSFSLDQNYPNPFNPSTSIRYTLGDRSNVSLAVYDILGRRAATLAHGIEEAGSHSVTMNGTRLPAGSYVIRLQAKVLSTGEAVLLTRKITLVK